MDGRLDATGREETMSRDERVRESGLWQLRAAQEADGLRLAPLLHLQCVV